MKRVKFVIPQKVDKGALLTAGKYSKFDGKEVPENVANCIIGDGLRDWIHEIEDGPVMIDDPNGMLILIEGDEKRLGFKLDPTSYKQGFRRGEQNYRKWTQSVIDAGKEIVSNLISGQFYGDEYNALIRALKQLKEQEESRGN